MKKIGHFLLRNIHWGFIACMIYWIFNGIQVIRGEWVFDKGDSVFSCIMVALFFAQATVQHLRDIRRNPEWYGKVTKRDV
jgi:hypothetical protein